MTQRKPAPTPIEAFLAPLAALAARQPEIEGLVYWGDAGGWDDAPSEALESEEIAFYAEGLLEDGFCMAWSVVALAEKPAVADHIRLYFWQEDAPPPPDLDDGWVAQATGRWPIV